MKTHRRRLAVVCAAGVLLAALWMAAASRATATKSRAITVAGGTRTYLLHVPSSYDANQKMPLVLVLHGATQSPESAEQMSGMSELADREDFLVAYPRATGNLPTWNSGNCCGLAMREQIDDVAFIRNLIDKLERDYPIDPKRVYVTGISNGAMMSFKLACELSDKIAGIAPVEGAQNLECRPAQRVSVLIFQGNADRLVPFDGGATPFQVGGRREDTPVMDTLAFWTKEDDCASTPQRNTTREVDITMYSDCADGAGVALYAIQGGRHTWPGTRLSGNGVRATDIMWTFFDQHPKR